MASDGTLFREILLVECFLAYRLREGYFENEVLGKALVHGYRHRH